MASSDIGITSVPQTGNKHNRPEGNGSSFGMEAEIACLDYISTQAEMKQDGTCQKVLESESSHVAM